jgi:mRNA-degrading endonuclease toxin of MazEF toxin-antitoxin module
MPSTTRYKRGDIVLVAFPFTDLSSTKRRPALVVSPDTFNAHLQDLVLVAITSQIKADDTLIIDPTDCSDGILPKRSAVRVGKMFTINSSLVVKRLCSLRGQKTKDVLSALKAFFS